MRCVRGGPSCLLICWLLEGTGEGGDEGDRSFLSPSSSCRDARTPRIASLNRWPHHASPCCATHLVAVELVLAHDLDGDLLARLLVPSLVDV